MGSKTEGPVKWFNNANRIALVTATLLGLVCMPCNAAAVSSSERGVIFVGIGSAGNKVADTQEIPWSIGFLLRQSNDIYWGMDFGAEGTKLDNRSRRINEIGQGFSFNLHLGTSLKLNGNYRLGVGSFIGGRSTNTSCPDSFLGLDCYAGEDPSVEYAVNYGALVFTTLNQVFLGVRAASESTQFTIGVSF